MKIPVGWNPDPSTPPQHRWWDGGATSADPNARELPTRTPRMRWLGAGLLLLAIVFVIIALVSARS